MPTICRFRGIIIAMFHNDHAPPHFHASCGDAEALIDIKSFAVLAGHLPPRTLDAVQRWASAHSDELLRNWDLAREGKLLRQIAPLV